VLKYRASNLAKKDQYGLWLDDGTGRRGNGLEVFKLSQLIADGEFHELRADLRTLKPAGNINGMAVGVFCGDKAPAIFELLGVRFDPPGKPAKNPPELNRGGVLLNLPAPAYRCERRGYLSVDLRRPVDTSNRWRFAGCNNHRTRSA
jgi:hypothetical protein